MALIVPTQTMIRRFAVETFPNSRGFISWKPQLKSLEMLDKVAGILGEYIDLLPLSIRQVFYRLVAKHNYPKTGKAYSNLSSLLTKARRNRREFHDSRLHGGRMLLFDALRDDKFVQSSPNFYRDAEHFFDVVRSSAERIRLDRQRGQERQLVVWCEAKGMLPMLERIAHPFGVPVYSCGGYDSLTAKYKTANDWLYHGQPITVLYVGDLDPGGVDMSKALAEDLISFAGIDEDIEFIRLAVTPAQVETYNLASGIAKPKENGAEGYNKVLLHLSTTGEQHTFHQGFRMVGDRAVLREVLEQGKYTFAPILNPDETWEAESLDPATFARIVRDAVNDRMDQDIYQANLSEEEEVRAEVLSRLAG